MGFFTSVAHCHIATPFELRAVEEEEKEEEEEEVEEEVGAEDAVAALSAATPVSHTVLE